jgi:parallel beta-helix repeat protein
MQIKSVFLFLVLAGFVFSSSLLADIVDPVGDVEINQNRIFNVTVNVSCSDGACGDVNVSLNNYQSSCKALLDAGLSTGDGVYTIYPPGHPEGVDVYCDMTTDGGGWTLVFGGMGSTSTYASTWYGWFAEGNTTALEDKSTEGKSVAYDTVPVSTIMLESTYGTDGVIIADLDQTYDSLLDLVGPNPGCNDGSSQWNNGFAGPFDANYPATGSHFVNDWIRIWVGDTSYDCEDRAVFATELGTHGDWAGSDNPGAIGGEYRTARSGSDWYYVWVRGPGFALPESQTINLGDDESQNVTFSINATNVGGSTYYAYAEQVNDSGVNDTSDEFMVFVYPPPMVEFLSPPTYVSDNNVNISLNTSYFLEGIDSVWWNYGAGNITYTGETTQYLDDGVYTLTAYANDSTGYLASTGQILNVNLCGLELDSDFTLEYDMDCSEYPGDVLTVVGDDVTIDCDGHSIIGGGQQYIGIYSNSVTGTVVQNCHISGFDDGINFGETDGGQIINNTLEDNEDGVYLDSSDDNDVEYNDFLNNDYGFYLYYADNNRIGHNYVDLTYYSNFGSGSCPFLYLWDGEEYNYYTDLASESLGGSWFETPLYEAGIYELGDFQSEDGVYKMKVREVIPESDFFDEAKLAIVDVPEGYSVLNQWHNTYSDDEAPPKEFMTIKDPKKPVSATDRYGNDVLDQVSEKDGVPLATLNSEPNYVIVDFGAIENPEYAKLVITGWSTYQSNPELSSQKNLVVETMDENGEWAVAKTFGKFTGDTRTFVFDISDILKTDDARMRISAPYSKTVLNIIDQVLLDDSEPVDFEVTYVDPDYANLQWGGAATYTYATEDHSHIVANDQIPNVENYLMYGDFTKYGNVLPLLDEADDMFAIMRHGDELEMQFSDIEPKEGMDRHVFLVADVMYTIRYSVKGFVSDTIEQMPFHGMSEYPYDESVENYPYDQAHTDYITEWNTRTYEKPPKLGASLPYSFNNTVFENVLIGGPGDYGIVLDNEEFTYITPRTPLSAATGLQTLMSASTSTIASIPRLLRTILILPGGGE